MVFLPKAWLIRLLQKLNFSDVASRFPDPAAERKKRATAERKRNAAAAAKERRRAAERKRKAAAAAEGAAVCWSHARRAGECGDALRILEKTKGAVRKRLDIRRGVVCRCAAGGAVL